MSLRHLVAASLCIASTGVSAAAQTFDINLNNNVAMLTYTSPLGQQGFGHGQAEGSILFTDEDTFLGDVGFGVVGPAGNGSPGLVVGVGVKLYGVNTRNSDVAALAIGGQFDYAPPPLSRLRFGGSINFAPGIVTFIDGDRLSTTNVYMGYEIFQNAVAYLGYRHIKVDIHNGRDVTVDSGGNLGVKFAF